MASKINSSKRIQIDKANATMVVVMAISSFVIVFSLVASKALFSQRSYQSRVITQEEQARDQLKSNISSAKTLINSYKVFVGTSQNVLGGNPDGQGGKDGNNAQIVLDALPSSYDFPAVTSSLEAIITQNGLSIQSITGKDDEISQQKAAATPSPQPFPMPFEIKVSGQYTAIQNTVGVFESSIRPFDFTDIKLSGTDANLTADIQAQTYYQPATSLNIKTTTVK